MNRKIITLILLPIIALATAEIIYCDSITHTSPFNIIEGIRWDIRGHTVTLGSDYPVSGIELANGSLLATWTPMIDDYDMTANITGSLSGDGGITWSDPFILVKNTGKKLSEEQYVYNNGSLYQFYEKSNETQYKANIEPAAILFEKSLDGSVTNWSAPIKIINNTNYISITSPPIRFSTGRWIIPIERQSPISASGFSSVLYSDDFSMNGLNATWKEGGKISDPKYSMWELSIVETSPGNLTGLMRFDDKGGWFWESLSRDGGITWTAPAQSNIPAPNARPHLMKLQDGKILLLWNNNQKERNPLSVAILNDSATGIVSELNITGRVGGDYHNMGLIRRSNGDVIILAATNDIPRSYITLPGGFEYISQYAPGVQAFVIQPDHNL